MESGPWKDQRGEKETSWEVGPETQIMVSWSRVLIREMMRSSLLQTVLEKKQSGLGSSLVV